MSRLTTIHADIERDELGLDKDLVDIIITSPPYKVKDGWSEILMKRVAGVMGTVLKPGGVAFVNLGQLSENPGMPMESWRLLRDYSGLKAGQTIAWVKSIAVGDVTHGHFQPINSQHLLNYCWEFIFTFYKEPRRSLDSLSAGVPYMDQSNLKRGSRGKNGNVHCAGDAWFEPYQTTGKTKKKAHRHSYPEGLVERMLKVSGATPGDVLLDPFLGGGTTVMVGKRFGMQCIGIDRDWEAIQDVRKRWQSDGI